MILTARFCNFTSRSDSKPQHSIEKYKWGKTSELWIVTSVEGLSTCFSLDMTPMDFDILFAILFDQLRSCQRLIPSLLRHFPTYSRLDSDYSRPIPMY